MVRRVKRLPILFVLCAFSACSGTGASTLLGDAAVDSAVDAQARADAPQCKLTSPYSTKDQDCNVCAEAKCCTPINACLASKDCNDGYVNCIVACAITEKDKAANDRCSAVCAKDYPDGEKLFTTFSACVDNGCVLECGN